MPETATTDEVHEDVHDDPAGAVDVLLADLVAGRGMAERAVVHGTWDWLRGEPDAAAVHPWLDAAVVGRLPREQRAEALSTRSLAPATWPVAIGRPLLPRDCAPVTAWLRHQGVDAALAALLREAVRAMPGSDTCDAGYDDLLTALLHAEYDGDDFPDEELALLVLDYAAVHERLAEARAGVGEVRNSTLRPLLGDLGMWGPAVAPHLIDCLLDAADTTAAAEVADDASDWAAPGVRAALRGRFAADRSAAVHRAVEAAEHPHPGIAEGARAFLAEDVRAGSLQRVRAGWGRRERDRLDAALRAPRAGRRRGLGLGARLRDAARRSVD